MQYHWAIELFIKKIIASEYLNLQLPAKWVILHFSSSLIHRDNIYHLIAFHPLLTFRK